MIRYENDCVDCGQPCLGIACPHHKVPHYYCDECGEETDLYYFGFDGEELCLDCIESRLDKVGE